MIRRLLVLGAVGVALAGGARFALGELAGRRWETRKAELRALALFPSGVRRPWELRFEALVARLSTSERFSEIVESPYRSYIAWGSGEQRPLDDFEKIWLESLWNELAGLDSLLAEVRALPLEELAWGGGPTKLMTLREITNALCGRAWLAVEAGDGAAAAQAYGDALRLALATDDGSSIGAMIHVASDGIVLRAVRSALAFGAPPRTLRAVIEPLLAGWEDVPDRAERAIRRDLALGAATAEDEPDSPVEALRQFAGVEAALALARGPAEELVRARDDRAASEQSLQVAWTSVPLCLHGMHAQRNVALTALAVAELRQERGTFPASLAEVETLPRKHAIDPLTDELLPYSLTDSGARIGPAAWAAHDAPVPEDSLYAWTLR